MSGDELRGLPDRELLVLLHERVEVSRREMTSLKEKVESMERALEVQSRARAEEDSIWSFLRMLAPWLLTAAGLYIAGRSAHLW